jgi:hypothetical protein
MLGDWERHFVAIKDIHSGVECINTKTKRETLWGSHNEMMIS